MSIGISREGILEINDKLIRKNSFFFSKENVCSLGKMGSLEKWCVPLEIPDKGWKKEKMWETITKFSFSFLVF